jgi:hypothetical protein
MAQILNAHPTGVTKVWYLALRTSFDCVPGIAFPTKESDSHVNDKGHDVQESVHCSTGCSNVAGFIY